MRPSTKDLLKIRDGEPVDAVLVSAVTTDPELQHELHRLKDVQVGLRNLAELTPPADLWEGIQARAALPGSTTGGSEWPRWLGTVAAAAAVALVAVMVISRPGQEPTQVVQEASDNQSQLASSLVTPQLASLVAESRRLEQVVAGFGAAPRLVNTATAGSIVELQDQILWIDDRLNQAVLAGRSPARLEALWRERVRLMNLLATLRYAQAQRFAF
jgi:hypothetical protein